MKFCPREFAIWKCLVFEWVINPDFNHGDTFYGPIFLPQQIKIIELYHANVSFHNKYINSICNRRSFLAKISALNLVHWMMLVTLMLVTLMCPFSGIEYLHQRIQLQCYLFVIHCCLYCIATQKSNNKLHVNILKVQRSWQYRQSHGALHSVANKFSKKAEFNN